MGRHHQSLQYQSPEWKAAYAGPRNTIEALNSFAKDTTHEALAAAGRRRILGVAAQSVLVAFLLFAANMRKIDTFCDKATVTSDGEIVKPRKTRARRRNGKVHADYLKTTQSAGSDPPTST